MFGSACFLGNRHLKIQFATPKTQFNASSSMWYQKLKKPTLLILKDDKKPSSCYICHYMAAIPNLHAGKGML
jgi:hypothetical protein